MIHRLLSRLPQSELRMDGALYMRRYYLTPRHWRYSARIHQIALDDAGRCLHDHPFSFVSIGLKGTYIEEVPNPNGGYEDNHFRVFRAPWILRRRATDLHRLVLGGGEVWTLVLMGPRTRTWGFRTPTGWVRHQDYDLDFYGGAELREVAR